MRPTNKQTNNTCISCSSYPGQMLSPLNGGGRFNINCLTVLIGIWRRSRRRRRGKRLNVRSVFYLKDLPFLSLVNYRLKEGEKRTHTAVEEELYYEVLPRVPIRLFPCQLLLHSIPTISMSSNPNGICEWESICSAIP